MHHRGWTITASTDGLLLFHPPGRHPMPPIDDGDLERVLARVHDQADMSGPIRVERGAGERFDLAYAVSTIIDAQDHHRRQAEHAAMN